MYLFKKTNTNSCPLSSKFEAYVPMFVLTVPLSASSEAVRVKVVIHVNSGHSIQKKLLFWNHSSFLQW